MKTKIFVVVVLILSVAMMTTGVFAWFTSTRTAEAGSISAGTLNIQLASNASSTEIPTDWSDTVVPPWNLTAMVPGNEVFGCLWVKNTGTVDSVGVRWDFLNLVNMKDGQVATALLENRMQITDLYTTDSQWNWPEALLPGGEWYFGGAYDENSDGMISLGEMSRWSVRFAPYTFDWVNDNGAVHFLVGNVPPGGVGHICMTLKMMNGDPVVDNTYQGVGLTYDVKVTANNPEISQTTP
jgi:predicted ribosomally synthesized peptide with SipW-like signal peptide